MTMTRRMLHWIMWMTLGRLRILIIETVQGKMRMIRVGQIQTMTLMMIMMMMASTTVNQVVRTIRILRNLQMGLNMTMIATEKDVKVIIDMVKRETKATNVRTSLERNLRKQVTK
jgi:hypothetical protein